MRKFSLSALVAAGLLVGGMSVSSASAADLGGNCCADLEERIAELEATTARKGNRKVSLTVSGWVGQQVMWWDDGAQAEHLRVVVSARPLAATSSSPVRRPSCRAGTAGYVLQLEAIGSDSLTISQGVPNVGPAPLLTRSNAPTACNVCSRSGSSRATSWARLR